MNQPSEEMDLGETYAFVQDEVIMLKTRNEFGDPVELSVTDALSLATWLQAWAAEFDPELTANASDVSRFSDEAE